MGKNNRAVLTWAKRHAGDEPEFLRLLRALAVNDDSVYVVALPSPLREDHVRVLAGALVDNTNCKIIEFSGTVDDAIIAAPLFTDESLPFESLTLRCTADAALPLQEAIAVRDRWDNIILDVEGDIPPTFFTCFYHAVQIRVVQGVRNCEHLATSLSSEVLKVLWMNLECDNPVFDAVAQMIPRCPALSGLFMRGCSPSPDAFLTFASAVASSQLTVLDISENGLTEEHAEGISVLTTTPLLRMLYVNKNRLENALIPILDKAPEMEEIAICLTGMNQELVERLAANLNAVENPKLKTIEMFGVFSTQELRDIVEDILTEAATAKDIQII